MCTWYHQACRVLIGISESKIAIYPINQVSLLYLCMCISCMYKWEKKYIIFKYFVSCTYWWYRCVSLLAHHVDHLTDRQTSNIRCTKSQNLDVSGLVLSLSLPSPSKQCVSWEWRCSWSIWVINKVDCLLRCNLYDRFDSNHVIISRFNWRLQIPVLMA